MWQKCPVCNGTGKIYSSLSTSSSDVCSVCNGAKIISELSGLPPKSVNANLIDKTEDVEKINRLEKLIKP